MAVVGYIEKNVLGAEMDEDSKITGTLVALNTRLRGGETIERFGRLTQEIERQYTSRVSNILTIYLVTLVICGYYLNSEHIPVSAEIMWFFVLTLIVGGVIWLVVDAKEKQNFKDLPASERLVVVTNKRVLSLHMSNFDMIELGLHADIFEIADADGVITVAMADGKKIRMKMENRDLLLDAQSEP